MTCPMCKGTGIIDHVYPSGCGKIIHEDVTCPLCRGKGQI